ncbi:hypothetical protein TIFTF001_041199 [Ficus carica]|uniref:CCHC-type domain-containing protein n=1 Tax=Ficus carica TaxID=3494 RepID=A0AA88CRK4_FICCA|nr:hypothetical protein TIFTF001_041195 [Ficus carica]GMN28628.1 hypothetical protein TIFTF001_041199 [Ficus carica]
MGTNACYLCGKEGHYARNCNQNFQNQNPPYPNRNAPSQLHAVQAKIEGPSISQGKLEAPEPQARIFAYTRGDAEAGTSQVVTGQISITTPDTIAAYDAIALFDSGATHSFVSLEFGQKVRTKSAQPPDKARVCKALTVLGILTGPFTITNFDHGRFLPAIKRT